VEVGSVVGIGVGQPSGNTVQIFYDGSGAYRAEWNGGRIDSFTGARAIDVVAKRARRDQVTINLNDPATASPQIQLRSSARTEAVTTAVGKEAAIRLRTSGSAVQTGTLLSVTVNKPSGNAVQILDQGEGALEVEWNGGAVHSFTGVTTIDVTAERGRNDRITFDTSTLS
jgi:hypothetical protein